MLCNAAQADGPVQLGQVSVSGEAQTQAAPQVGVPVTVITADDLKAWGVSDLADALSLVAGATPARGGDAGPAGLIPGLVGAREADDYLLVVDGVPLGSTSSPPFESVSLTDVERIEVRRGPDAVVYGSASFAGAIYIYHYAAGRSAQQVSASTGSYGSHGFDVAVTLPELGEVRQSLAATASHDAYSDPRAQTNRYQLLYRAATPLGDGSMGLDANLLDLKQSPMSPVPVTDQGLDPGVAVDSNQNPPGAELDEYRSQITLDYSLPLAGGTWDSLVYYSRLHSPVQQGFLGEDDNAPNPDSNAVGYSQVKHLNEAYLDSHWSRDWSLDLSTTFGANDMYGNGHASTATFDYTAPLPAGQATAASEQPTGDSYAADRRSFFGVYAMMRWRFAPAFTLNAGLRESVTDERRFARSGEEADADPTVGTSKVSRTSASAMLSWRAWDEDRGSLVPFVAYADSFQPLQFDFNPDPGEDSAPLAPETVRSWQLGVRGSMDELEWELTGAQVEFADTATTQQVGGLPTLVSGGSNHFRDFDLDMDLLLSECLRLKFSYEHVDARYVDFSMADDTGDVISLSDNRLPRIPRAVASLGLSYGGGTGFNGSVSAQFLGSRYLDSFNQVLAPGFVSYDCSLGYSTGHWSLFLSGENLTDRRDPYAASAVGDGQVYRLFGRRFMLKLTRDL